jgi:hypothetical protein
LRIMQVFESGWLLWVRSWPHQVIVDWFSKEAMFGLMPGGWGGVRQAGVEREWSMPRSRVSRNMKGERWSVWLGETEQMIKARMWTKMGVQQVAGHRGLEELSLGMDFSCGW